MKPADLLALLIDVTLFGLAVAAVFGAGYMIGADVYAPPSPPIVRSPVRRVAPQTPLTQPSPPERHGPR